MTCLVYNLFKVDMNLLLRTGFPLIASLLYHDEIVLLYACGFIICLCIWNWTVLLLIVCDSNGLRLKVLRMIFRQFLLHLSIAVTCDSLDSLVKCRQSMNAS